MFGRKKRKANPPIYFNDIQTFRSNDYLMPLPYSANYKEQQPIYYPNSKVHTQRAYPPYHPFVTQSQNFGVYQPFHYQNQEPPYFAQPPSNFMGNTQPKQSSNGYIFQNPLEPEEGNNTIGWNTYQGGNQNPYMHPYPKQTFAGKPPSGMKSILNSFKTQDGNLDVNKMIDTAGQMVNAVSQVQGMVKGLGGIFKV